MLTSIAGSALAASAATTGVIPDAAFGTNLGAGFNGTVWSVSLDASGKMVVGGDFTTLNGAPANRLVRLNADGTPDAAFGTNLGAGFNGTVTSVSVESSGKILLGGGFLGSLRRLNADGTSDVAFNANVGTSLDGFPRRVDVDALGKVLIGGYFVTLNGVPAQGLVRLNADGTPDTSFNANLGTGFDRTVWSIATDAVGKVVVGGEFTTLNGAAANGLVRLNPDGTPDTTFNTNLGAGFNSAALSVAMEASGKLVVGGDFTALNGTRENYLARLNQDGTLDAAFNTNPDIAFNNTVYSVVLDAPGKLVVGGEFTNLNGAPANRLVRLASLTVSAVSPPNQSTVVGSPVNLPVAASASDGGAVTFSAAGLPPGLTIDPATGDITGTPTTTSASQVTVSATRAGVTDRANFTWTISSALTPVISTLTPTTGPVSGGTTVTITGKNLTGTTSVGFDGIAGGNVQVSGTGTSLTVTTPVHAAGAVDVTVNNPGGNATTTGGFTYLPPAANGTTPTGSVASSGGTRGGGLARTGSDIPLWMGVVALVLTLAGASAFFGAGRRKDA